MPHELPDLVAADQERWRRTRCSLNSRRGELAELATGLYGSDVRVGELPFLAPRHWMPAAPVPLDEIRLELVEEVRPARTFRADGVLPLREPGRRFARYTDAIAALDPPALFENRTSYRLLDMDLSEDPRMRFGLGTYFDKLDVGEALAHELAGAPDPPQWAALPLRTQLGEPFDLHHRAVMPAIETLTLRRVRDTGAATFLLHWRDPAKVATTGGVHGLVPAGEFQPSTDARYDRENDFDLWRGIVREYSEELLGEPERAAGKGRPLDYDRWPLYAALAQARHARRVRAYCLGAGLDPLTLTATVLTVTVFDDDVFDELFAGTVEVNAEGRLVRAAGSTTVSEGLPLTGDFVARLLATEALATPAACTLTRAHVFRDVLIAERGT
jgi:hypothetical protein